MKVHGRVLLRLTVAGFSAAVVSAQNPFSFTTLSSISTGTPFDITWTPSTGTSDTVTLVLREGAANSLHTVLTIATSIQNTGSYLWTPPTTLTPGSDYAFEIIDDANTAIVNYSGQFSIVSAGSGASNAASGAHSATTTTAATLVTSTASSQTPIASTQALTQTSTQTSTASTQTSTASTQTSTLKTTATSLSSTSSTIPSSSVTAASTSIQASPSSTPNTHHGLSSGAAAGIGVGCTLGALIFLAVMILAIRLLKQKKKGAAEEESGIAELASGTKAVAELGSGNPLDEEEIEELKRRKRAAELEGSGSRGGELFGGEMNPRAELEVLREKARVAYEKEA